MVLKHDTTLHEEMSYLAVCCRHSIPSHVLHTACAEGIWNNIGFWMGWMHTIRWRIITFRYLMGIRDLEEIHFTTSRR